MKAIALIPGTTTIRLVDRPEPQIQAPDEIKLRVLRVGVCGTDREEVDGGRSLAPEGLQDLVIGHEMFGQVVEAGQRSQPGEKPGDYAVFTVRRGCGNCLPCAMNRSDMCLTGEYHERGIGAWTVIRPNMWWTRNNMWCASPRRSKRWACCASRLSVAEKAIDEAVRVQTSRLPDAPASPDWLNNRSLPGGRAGTDRPAGGHGAAAARRQRLRAGYRGCRVHPAAMVEQIGGKYVDGRQVKADQVDDQIWSRWT